MIFTAILVACLISAPEECRTTEFLIYGNGIPYGPAIEAQTRAAKWVEDHPGMQQRSLVVRVGRGV